MAKRSPGVGKCVHCLNDPVTRNWDHVFPRSWYPDTTPPNIAKWKVPSCLECNRELGIIENDLFVRLAPTLDPALPGSSGLYERARRAIDPASAKNKNESRARRNSETLPRNGSDR